MQNSGERRNSENMLFTWPVSVIFGMFVEYQGACERTERRCPSETPEDIAIINTSSLPDSFVSAFFFLSAPGASFDLLPVPNPAHFLTFLSFQIISYRRLQLAGSQNALLHLLWPFLFRSFLLVWMSVQEAAKLQHKHPHRLRKPGRG